MRGSTGAGLPSAIPKNTTVPPVLVALKLSSSVEPTDSYTTFTPVPFVISSTFVAHDSVYKNT